MENQKLNRRLREINELEKILEKEKRKLIREKMKLQYKCPHTIIIEATDKKPHKVGPISTYVCPICEKIGHIHHNQDIEKTPFANSKIINLTSLNCEEYVNFFTIVTEEILSNYDYYYNPNISLEELAETIIERIKQPNKKRQILSKKEQ